jgi:DDE family transposase
MRLGLQSRSSSQSARPQGFLSLVVELMQLTLPIPDYSTVSLRHGALQVPVSALLQSCSLHIVIDATGLRVYGAGE